MSASAPGDTTDSSPRPWLVQWLVSLLVLAYVWCFPIAEWTGMGAWPGVAGRTGLLLATRTAQFTVLAWAAYVAICSFPFGAVGRTRWRNTALMVGLGVCAAAVAAAFEAWARVSVGAAAANGWAVMQQAAVLYALFIARGQILRVRGRLHHGEVAELRLEASLSEAEQRRAQAELRMLRREMNPHFMFNALQTVQALIVRDPRAAARAVVRLGDVLREALRRSEVQEITLAEEMERLRSFLEFEELRMNGPLSVEWAVADDALPALVPHLVLQPLLENAVKHGIAPRGGGRIRVGAARRGEWLEIRVVDEGAGPRRDESVVEEGAGIGLANTRGRLQALYGDAHSFAITDAPEGSGAAATLRIPFHTAPLPPPHPRLPG